jgi:hypothetical protein
MKRPGQADKTYLTTLDTTACPFPLEHAAKPAWTDVFLVRGSIPFALFTTAFSTGARFS